MQTPEAALANKPPTRPLRNEFGQLLPGHTANKRGRPRLSEEAREALEILNAATPAAARRLVQLVNSEDAKVALPAALSVLKRVLGDETVGESDGNPVEGRSGLSFEQMLKLLEVAKSNGVDPEH